VAWAIADLGIVKNVYLIEVKWSPENNLSKFNFLQVGECVISSLFIMKDYPITWLFGNSREINLHDKSSK